MKMVDIVRQCKDDIGMMNKQIDRMRAGDKLHAFIGGRQVDVTDEWVGIYEKRIIELNTLIKKYSETD